MAQPQALPQPDILYVCFEGTGELVTAADSEGRLGEGEEGTRHTRESKTAVVFTETITDETGLPVRDPASSTYVACFTPDAEFGTLMVAEAQRRGATNARHLVILGDGTAWICNLSAQHFPEATSARGSLPCSPTLARASRVAGVHARRPQRRMARPATGRAG